MRHIDDTLLAFATGYSDYFRDKDKLGMLYIKLDSYIKMHIQDPSFTMADVRDFANLGDQIETQMRKLCRV